MYTGKCAVANGVEILKLRQLLASLKLDWDIVLEDGIKRSSTNNSVENTTKMVEYENKSDPSITDDDDLWALPPILFEQPKTPTKVKSVRTVALIGVMIILVNGVKKRKRT